MKVKKLVIILGIMILMNTVLVLGEDFINGEMELTREENTQAEELDRIGLSNGTYEYCIKEDDTITITKYIGSESYIIVPETIDGKIVNTIENRTFEGNDEVKRIEISKTISEIEWGAFNGCLGLEEIQVNPENSFFMGENGVLFNKDKTLIVSYPAGKTEMKFTIPSTVNTLGINSFSGNLFLKEVTIDISVEKIDSDVFTGCSNLEKIAILGNVHTIGDNAFYTEEPVVVIGYEDSYVQTYAKKNGIPFEKILKGTIKDLSMQWAETIEGIIPFLTDYIVAVNIEGETGTVKVIWDAINDSVLQPFAKIMVEGTVEGTTLRASNRIIIKKENGKAASEEIGNTTVLLNGQKEQVRKGETNLSKLATNSIQEATGADIVLLNSGSIRTSINPGTITMGDIIQVFPFGNYAVKIIITGEELIKALEHGTREYPNPSGGFPQVAGITYGLNLNKPQGERIENVKVNGIDIEKEKQYTLATNRFLTMGGDGYTMLDKSEWVSYYANLDVILAESIEKISSLTEESTTFPDRLTIIPLKEVKPEPPSGGGSSGGSSPLPLPEKPNPILPEVLVVFKDIPDSLSWAKESIDYLAQKKIMNGKTKDLFVPYDAITRAEFIAILSRVADVKLEKTITQVFDDVDVNKWYADCATWGFETGIVTGVDGKLNPQSEITRQDMAVMLLRYAEKIEKSKLPSRTEKVVFIDEEQIADYAKEAVTKMQRADVMNGKGDGSFDPMGMATRAEVAKTVATFMKVMKIGDL